MSNALFPRLPGIQWGVKRTPVWRTKVQTAASGRELRAAYWSYPQWRYQLSYEILRADARQELQQLVGFFNAHQGSFDSWLYEDPADCAAIHQPLGLVRAGVTRYQLVRTLGGFVEPVFAPMPNPVVIADNKPLVAAENYQLGADGAITLLSGASAGQMLSWTGGFYWRCRFVQDSAEFEEFLHQLWAARKIEFQTIKP